MMEDDPRFDPVIRRYGERQRRVGLGCRCLGAAADRFCYLGELE